MRYNFDRNRYNRREDEEYNYNYCTIKNHNHEFLSSTDYEKDDERVIHNHRIAGTTGPAIKCGKSHVHKIKVLTDTFDDHFHGICDTTGPAIFLPGGKHIHLVKGETTCNDGHQHDFYFTTLIEDPTNVPEDKKC
jgi:hypothetical protein